MKIGYYDRDPDGVQEGASLEKWVGRLKKYPHLFSMVMAVLEDVEKNCVDLRKYARDGRVKRLRNIREPIYEFRIPKSHRDGVVRLYFCLVPGRQRHIYILSGEVKRGKSSSDRVLLAQKRYREKFG